MIKKIMLFFVFFICQKVIFAQCAMCKAVVEADLESGGTKGAGLNDGILYLMAVPYIVILFFAVFYFLQKRNKEAIDSL